jgi:phospholipid-binding lipoprotein MlaA
VWGVNQGPYLVLPVLGPTTVRDGGAIVVDKAANPGTYVPGTGILEGINDRANAEGALNFIDEAALDPYVFTRESFLQYRQNLINDGKADTSNYDLDVDDAIDDSGKQEKGVKPAAGNSSKLELPKDAGQVSVNDNTNQAFDSMSKSFQNAEMSFEQASEKMDQFSQKKRRFKHR